MLKPLVLILLAVASANAFEKLDAKYRVAYGQPDAKHRIVEYVSLSCPKCIDSIRNGLHQWNDVFWEYHPVPADIATLQAMVCLEHLSANEKPIFLEVISKHVAQVGKQGICLLMQAAMNGFEKPLPDLDKMEFLEQSAAFRKAVDFLKQKDVIQVIPTVEIDGVLLDQFPNRDVIEQQLKRSQ